MKNLACTFTICCLFYDIAFNTDNSSTPRLIHSGQKSKDALFCNRVLT